MKATEQGEVVKFISEVAPNAYADTELDQWAHTLTPLDIPREQWEPCVRAWRFTDPPTSGNRLADLFARLREIHRQGQQTGRADPSGDEPYIADLRARIAENPQELSPHTMTVRYVVLVFWKRQAGKCGLVYGHIPEHVTHQAAQDIRQWCEPETSYQAFAMLAWVVGDDQARAFKEHRAAIIARAKGHNRELRSKLALLMRADTEDRGGFAGEVVLHDGRPEHDPHQRERVCDELTEVFP